MSEEELVRECDKYIEEHCMKGGKATLSDCAKKTGYNPSYLSRRYKEATGNNLMEYFQAKRIETARILLCEGKSVTYVATFFEYSKNGFTKAYRKATGENPSCVYKKYKGEKQWNLCIVYIHMSSMQKVALSESLRSIILEKIVIFMMSVIAQVHKLICTQ